jgi:hypothetical protein
MACEWLRLQRQPSELSTEFNGEIFGAARFFAWHRSKTV